MAISLNSILKKIEASKTISESEKQWLTTDLLKLQKQIEKDNFKLKRIQKDKSITVNILNATIADLEQSKLRIEKNNKQLYLQQKELEAQKKIIEEKSEKLSENLKKLELSYKELEQFSYIASHDLKTPLRTIASFAQLLKKRYENELKKEGQDFIDFIVSGTTRMHSVIHALLDYSKVGKEANIFEEVNINDTVAAVEQIMQKDIQENNAKILRGKLPTIIGYKTGILQLFQNLISNAIKFRSEKDPLIKICSTPKGRYWEFQVMDNGIGLDENFQKKAFFPFQRLNNLEKPGVGIGLAICKKVVDLHHGNILFKANKEGGTIFIFDLASMTPIR